MWKPGRRPVDRDASADVWIERGSELMATDLDAAEQCYLRAIEIDDSSSVAWFDLGLISKWRQQWSDCLVRNRRSAELLPPDGRAEHPAFWNAGIAATALRDWGAARWAWRAYGIPIADGDGPIAENFGRGVVRLPDGETVWGVRIDPARMRLESIPLPQGGFRCNDIVLHDGEPVGARVSAGREYTVFNVIERWQPSSVPTIEVHVDATASAVAKLVDAAVSLGVPIENWTESINVLCVACSNGRVDYDDPDHHHHHGSAGDPDDPVRLAIAAEESVVRDLLASWSTGGGSIVDVLVHG